VRRDFGKLLSLIAACAILYQEQRERTSTGAIEAALEDYACVFELVAESFTAAQQEGLTPAQREAVQAVATLATSPGHPSRSGVSVAPLPVSAAAVAAHLGIDKSAALRRLANPLRAGFVRNLETRSRQAAQYVPGDPLPPTFVGLPSPDELAAHHQP